MPAYEKALSLDVLVTGIHRYFFTNSPRIGKLRLWSLQKERTLKSSISSFGINVKKYLWISSFTLRSSRWLQNFISTTAKSAAADKNFNISRGSLRKKSSADSRRRRLLKKKF